MIMPLTLPNTTLNLSTVDQLKTVYEYVVAELSLVDPPNPFTNGLLRQSDQDIAKLIHDVISANLVSVGCSTLPSFSIQDYDNDTLVKVLIDQLNYSITACNLGDGEGDEGGSTGLLLIPTGAVESADGEYQRFAYDGASTMIGSPSYVAELDPSDWQPNPTIKFKLPSLTQAGQSVALYLFNGDFANLSVETFTVNNLIITADLNGDAGAYQLAVDHLSGRAGIGTTVIDPVPAAGTEITISIISRSSMLISFGSENIPVTLPTGFLATTLNIVLMSRASDTAVPPLSIQVTGVEVA